MSTSKTVVIMSGLPGSGKSYYAAKLAAECSATVCSADDYFVTSGGEYAFDPSKLGEAHAACMRRFAEALLFGYQTVIVDNTNTTALEIAPYYALARAFGYDVILRTWNCDPEVAMEQGTHGVPFETLVRMAEALERREVPEYWDLLQEEDWTISRKAYLPDECRW
jgi:predicted kinase